MCYPNKQKKMDPIGSCGSSKMNAIARTAQRLDAEYDGGHSDVGDDSADSEDSPLKLQTANSRCTARAKHAFRLSRAGR